MNFWLTVLFSRQSKGAELYIVAEEWRDPEQWLMGDTADGTMNYTLRDLILRVLRPTVASMPILLPKWR